jgi:hypothetical protein
MLSSPSSTVRVPKHVAKTGKAPAVEGAEWRKPLSSILTETVGDLRGRSPIATLIYSFAPIGAALEMKVEDLRPNGSAWTIRLHEKGRQAFSHALPARARWNVACLYRGDRHCGGPHGFPLRRMPGRRNP